MAGEIARIAYLFLPLIAGLIFHGFCIRFGWLLSLAKPIDRGATLRGRPLFGANKTWRGVVAVALGSGLVLFLQGGWLHGHPGFRGLELTDYAALPAGLLGCVLGAAAMLSELPNSLVKRQLGIAPGRPGSGLWEFLFYVADQIDMLVGAWLVLALAVPVTFTRIALSAVLFVVVHQVLSWAGYALGMRRSAR
ncbi:MAG: CDP-archaeol synthase [Myxococcales bacterium]|nr:CDP-archaeol synthase [Myxococcales bacterium]